MRVFGNQTSHDITRSLINAILRPVGMEPIGDIKQINSEESSFVGSIDCRAGRMDVFVFTEGRVLDLEAQRYDEDVAKRSLFYAAQMICDNTKKSSKLKDMPQAVVITLLDTRPLFPDSDEYFRIASLQWNQTETQNAQLCTDRIVFVLVELDKIRRRYTSLTEEVLNDETLAWLYLLAQGFRDEGETMEIAEKFPTIEEFAKQYGLALDDPNLKDKYRGLRALQWDLASQEDWRNRIEEEGREKGLAEGRAEGRAEGLQEGEKAERERLVAAMRANGVDEETIERVVQ